MKNLHEALDNWFVFNEWNSYQTPPKEFLNQLHDLGCFKLYNNFEELLTENDHYLVDFNGNELDINEILSSKEKFVIFVENQLNLSRFYDISFDQINEKIILARAHDATEPKNFIELVRNFKTESDFIAFVNEVLSDLGSVTHSTGTKNKYEVIRMDS